MAFPQEAPPREQVQVLLLGLLPAHFVFRGHQVAEDGDLAR
jgi:hypothetical protein